MRDVVRRDRRARKLLFHLDGLGQNPPPADAPADVAAKTVGSDASAQELRDQTAGAYASPAEVYEPVRDVPAAPPVDDDETSAEGRAYFEAASQGGSASHASPFHDHGDAPETTPARVYKVPGHEFRQVVHLYSQNVRSVLIAGWKTKAHHTATVADVWRRPQGSDQRWEQHHREVTRNHGAEPGYSDMKRYAICDDLPITLEEFIVGGECKGDWFIHHLCNDDTALQIYHAHGAWQDGSQCPGRRRFHKPSCIKPCLALLRGVSSGHADVAEAQACELRRRSWRARRLPVARGRAVQGPCDQAMHAAQ